MATALETDTRDEMVENTKPAFLRRVRIRGYKSIAFCDVSLQPLTILVGRNAAGKSNFLDALAFLRDVMDVGVGEAIKRRGGWPSIACRITDAQSIEIEIDVSFACPGPYRRFSDNNGPTIPPPSNSRQMPNFAGIVFNATYHLEIFAGPHSVAIMKRESLEIHDETNQLGGGFSVNDGVGTIWKVQQVPLKPDSPSQESSQDSVELLQRPGVPLLGVIGTQPFVDLGEGLRNIGCYNFQPEVIRKMQEPGGGFLLEKDGRNLAGVIERLKEIDPISVHRVSDYLVNIAEQIESFDVAHYGEYETVSFVLNSNSGRIPLKFDAASMSDGTLRVLASLMAVFQIVLPYGYPAVVGIEEPEASLHPAAMRALVDALDEATTRTQVLLTTHSAEMLDNPTIQPKNLLVVQMVDGQTRIGPVDEATIDIVRRKLDTLGGLERENQLEPNLDDMERQRQLSLAQEGTPS